MAYIIYPEKRYINDMDVIQWAHDKLVDAEIARQTTADWDMEALVESVKRPTLEEAIAYLEDNGDATFTKQAPRLSRLERLERAADAGFDTWDDY